MTNKLLKAIVFLFIISCGIANIYWQKKPKQHAAPSSSKRARQMYRTAVKKSSEMSSEDFIREMHKIIKTDKHFIDPYIAIAKQQREHPKEVIEILSLAVKNGAEKMDETLFRLAETYKSIGDYTTAQATLAKISDKNPYKQQQEEAYADLIRMIQSPVPFELRNLSYANSKQDEYFPSVTADDEILSVTRSEFGDFSSNEDLYVSRKTGNQWGAFTPIAELNNPSYNEGSQTISADGRYMFFVACNRPDGLGSCDIYYTINTNGRWSKPINAGAPLNSAYWESNPAFSPAGDEIFFTSNRQPSFGGRDLWHCKVEILENGQLRFSEPENMGRTINSPRDDYAPYIHLDNQTLYFLSNGHNGFGGSDIFVARKENNQWGKPQNMGYPINNEDNCYGFTLTGKGDKGYISIRNKEDASQGLDIYEFGLYKEIRPQVMSYVKGFVYDAESKKPLNAIVETFDYNNARNTISTTLSDRRSGEFTTFLPDTGQYGLNVRKSGYIFYSAKIITSKNTLNVYLQPIKSGNKITLNNIFFAFNSYELEPKSEREIMQLYSFLRKNPDVSIEIVGHTDNIGGENFNQTLSENRALAVMMALIEKGIDAGRLYYRGMGLSQPIASNNTEEGREKNRRVEFVIK